MEHISKVTWQRCDTSQVNELPNSHLTSNATYILLHSPRSVNVILFVYSFLYNLYTIYRMTIITYACMHMSIACSLFNWMKELLKGSLTGSRLWGDLTPSRIPQRQGEGNRVREQVITSLFEPNLLEYYGSKCFEVIWQSCNIYIKEFDFLGARVSSTIFIYNKSPTGRQTNWRGKLVGCITDFVNC